jgi:hypothetical protein
MANITVEILPEGPPLYPSGNTVHRNDTVTFLVEGIIGDIVVTFDTPSCFTSPGPLTIHASTFAVSMQQETVSSTVTKGPYGFTVTLPDETRRRYHNWEAKRGELDVSTDPEDPEDKRR